MSNNEHETIIPPPKDAKDGAAILLTVRRKPEPAAEKSSVPAEARKSAATALKAMSEPEKRLLSQLLPLQPPLKYPRRILAMSCGPDTEEYVIPDGEKGAVLEKLYPFCDCPKLEERRYDLHENQYFQVKDYRVIRERGRNFLVSPYYPHTGGMVIDWMPDADPDACEVKISKS